MTVNSDIQTLPRVHVKPVAWPVLDAEDREAVDAVMERGVLYRGPEVAALEKEWSLFTGARHVIAVSSCTHAIHVALAALGVGHGDDVVVPAYTFIGTVLPVVHLRATPVFVDVDSETGVVSAANIRQALTHNTRAVIPVHVHGLAADMPAISGVLGKGDVAVVEDACQGHGTRLGGHHVGTLGKLGCFSLNAVKALPAGQGGLVCTNDDQLAGRVRDLASHGVESDGAFVEAGFSYGLSELVAAVARTQLRKLPHRIEQARRNAAIINESLYDLAGVRAPVIPRDCEPSWHKYMIQLDEEHLRATQHSVAERRDGIVATLRQARVPVEVWQRRPLPAHPLFGTRPAAEFPIATRVLNRSFMLGSERYPLVAQPEHVVRAWAGVLRETLLGVGESIAGSEVSSV